MLTNVLVNNLTRTSLGTLELPLGDPSATSRMFTKEATGLDAADAVITTAPRAGMDDEIFKSARKGRRNVVLKVGFYPDYSRGDTISKLRQTLYKQLQPGKRVQLRFVTDDLPDMMVDGYVEKNEANPFTAEPEQQISIIAQRANLYSPSWKKYTMKNNIDTPINYRGTDDTFFRLNVTAGAGWNTITIKPQNGTSLQISATFQKDDLLVYSSIPGEKKLHRNRNGVITTLYDNIRRGDLDMTIEPDDTSFYVYTNINPGLSTYTLAYQESFIGL